MNLRRLGAFLLCAALLAAACREEPQTFPVEWLGRFYQAAAQWEMDQHAEAAQRYQAMLEPTGRDPAVLANLASSLLAPQRFEEAERYAREAAAAAPGQAEIQLVLAGTLAARQKRDEALALLRQTAAEHPGHVGAHYSLIGALHDDGTEKHLDEIARQYELLLGREPRNVAALLDAARVQAMRRDIAAAAALINRAMAQTADPPEPLAPYLEQLDAAVAAQDAEAVQRVVNIARNLMRGTDRFRMDILALGPVGDKLPRLVRHPLRPLSGPSPQAIRTQVAFEHASKALGLDRLGETPVNSLVVGSVLDDRSPALLACIGLVDHESGKTFGPRLFLRHQGLFTAVNADLESAGLCRGARFVDLNNDRRIDLLLFAAEGDRLYLNKGEARFEDATAGSGLDSFGPSAGALPFDFDHDGDLDLLRWNGTRLVLQANDGEGRLGEPLSRPGLPGDIAGIRDIHPRDLDDDGDIDLCVLSAAEPGGAGPFKLRVFSNERLASFREVTGELGDLAGPWTARPVFEDFDRDGLLEVVDARRVLAWEVGPGFKVQPAVFPAAGDKPARQAAAGDFDNDGIIDLLLVYEDGSTNLAGLKLAAGVDAIVDLDGDGLVDVLARDGAFRNVTKGAGNWLDVALEALNTGDSRFNGIGLGSTVEVRAGPHYQKRHVTGVTTHFGLGPYRHADVLRVVWPNGNYQNLEFRASDKIELAANQVVVEEQSLKGSCPYLYAWNGERFEFVTDVLWRSALGMSLGGGVLGHHGTADDYFKISGRLLEPRDGQYVLQFTEELWEAAYFDYCKLLVVDHPVDTDFFVDEKCLAPPYPPFEMYAVREPRPLVSAADGGGRDLAALLARRDGRSVAGFELTRYQGIVHDHDLILDLGPFSAEEQVRLFLQGWLWPTDASTNVAVSQNPLVEARPPVLSVIGADGTWRATDVVVGFPSGKNKTLVLDLTGRFATGDHRLRLSTNFAIFWDHVFLTVGPQDVELAVTELAVAAADLHARGISRAFARVPHGPTIPEYDLLDPLARWRDLEGWYTRCGDVTELLSAADSRYAIVGAGDEVTLRFDAAAVPALRPGWRRDFVIHTDGWLKDGDLNSATGQTVEPLPFHGMSAYPYPAGEAYPQGGFYDDYRRAYNTCYRDGAGFRELIVNQPEDVSREATAEE